MRRTASHMRLLGAGSPWKLARLRKDGGRHPASFPCGRLATLDSCERTWHPPEDCERLMSGVPGHSIGPVDVLDSTTPQLTYFIPVKDFATNRWIRSWEVNFHAPFILSKAALEQMIPRGSGSIVNISSGAAVGPGRGPYPEASGIEGGTCYGAEKAALERFTQGLASEVYQYGISVTCVSPSLVVPTPGTVYHNLVTGMDDPKGEPPALLADAALLLDYFGAAVVLCLPDDVFTEIPGSVSEFADAQSVRICPLAEVGNALMDLLQ